MLITSKAGSGKTSFVCDLVSRFLMSHRLPCVFISGDEVRHLPIDGLRSYIMHAAMGETYPGSWSDFVRSVEKLCSKRKSPFIIILDGINEHRDLSGFAERLEEFVACALESVFVRIVITCRSEYYNARFPNMMSSSFASSVYRVEDIGTRISKAHRRWMVCQYLRHYGIDRTALSEKVRATLELEPLLLRFFCEAYGAVGEEVRLPYMTDVYRDSVFQRYLDRKLEEIVRQQGTESLPGNVARHVWLDALNTLADMMIETRTFADIPLSGLESRVLEPLEALLAEDILVRKDLLSDGGALSDREVLNFTFDEFRDFLLADRLVTRRRTLPVTEFTSLIESLTESEVQIAEGLQRFLFYRAKREGDGQLLSILRDMSWYPAVFRECIFSVEEGLVTTDDATDLREQFRDSPEDAQGILIALLRNWRAPETAPLGTSLLFDLLEDMSEEQYDQVVRPLFELGAERSVFFSDEPCGVDTITEDIAYVCDSEAGGGYESCLPLIEFLTYLIPLKGKGYRQPAEEFLTRVAVDYPDLIFPMLSARIASKIRCVAAAADGLICELQAKLEALQDARRRSSDEGGTDQPGSGDRVFIRTGEHGHLICLDEVPQEGDFIRACGTRGGSAAAELASRMYACLFRGHILLKEQYTRYFAREYSTIDEYLYWHFSFASEVIQEVVRSLKQGSTVVWKKASAGGDYQLAQYLESDEGADLAERILRKTERREDEIEDRFCHE